MKEWSVEKKMKECGMKNEGVWNERMKECGMKE